MKYKVLLIAVLTILGLASCTKEKMIRGNWKVDYYAYDDYDIEEPDGKDLWRFSDSTCSITFKGNNYQCWYRVQDDNLFISSRGYNWDGELKFLYGSFYIDELKKDEMDLSGSISSTILYRTRYYDGSKRDDTIQNEDHAVIYCHLIKK